MARRPAQQGAGLEGWPNQALHDPAYWLKKKNFRKFRKSKMKKKTSQDQTKVKNPTFNILQANIDALKNKQTDLQKLFHDKNVHVALLQETQHQACSTNISGYIPHACNCDNCRGIITYVRKDVQCDVTPHTEDSPNDMQLATVWFGNKKYEIYNIYSSPRVDFTYSPFPLSLKSTSPGNMVRKEDPDGTLEKHIGMILNLRLTHSLTCSS